MPRDDSLSTLFLARVLVEMESGNLRSYGWRIFKGPERAPGPRRCFTTIALLRFVHSLIHLKPLERVRKQKTHAQSDFGDDEERFLEFRAMGQDDEGGEEREESY